MIAVTDYIRLELASRQGPRKRQEIKMDRAIIKTDRRPTLDDACGSYKLVDARGVYWGTYYVGFNWCGEKFVAEADPRDGLPW